MSLVLLSIILGLMLAEARLSKRHEVELRTRGAVEPPGDVYRLMAILYPACFIMMGLEGEWRARSGHGGAGTLPPEAVWLSGLLLFVASKALKYWSISALGPRWTFRVLVLPRVTLVTRGPYRYVAHPNYVAVVGELAGTAMMMSAWATGPLALFAFGAALAARIKVERRALRASSRR